MKNRERGIVKGEDICLIIKPHQDRSIERPIYLMAFSTHQKSMEAPAVPEIFPIPWVHFISVADTCMFCMEERDRVGFVCVEKKKESLVFSYYLLFVLFSDSRILLLFCFLIDEMRCDEKTLEIFLGLNPPLDGSSGFMATSLKWGLLLSWIWVLVGSNFPFSFSIDRKFPIITYLCGLFYFLLR